MAEQTSDAELPYTKRLLLVKADAIRCNGCKRHLGRMPQWLNGELGHGFQCEHCGCTSTVTTEGRPYGPRYAHWQSLVDEFAGYEKLSMLEDPFQILETVVLKDEP